MPSRLMRRLLVPCALLALAAPPEIRAGMIVWNDPAWQVTITNPADTPPFGVFDASGSGGDASFSASGSAFAQNDPGPGGPSGTSIVNFQRSFRVIDPTFAQDVTITPSLSGFIELNDPLNVGGSFGARVFAQVRVPKPSGDLLFEISRTDAGIINTSSPLTGLFAPGTYTISGRLETGAFAFSGPGTGRSNFTLNLATPGFASAAVPEPSSWGLLSGGLIALGAARRLRGRPARTRPVAPAEAGPPSRRAPRR